MFYNPFKPHIIQVKDKFYIRRLEFIWWEYLNKRWGWWNIYRQSEHRYDSEQEARNRFAEYKKSLEKPKIKVIKL